jgi:DNA modification methylase
MVNCIKAHHGENFSIYHGDCIEVIKGIPTNSVGLSVYSPPFSNLYIYSDSDRDMGNCKDDAEFLAHYEYLVHELYRITQPGRLVAVHCKDLVDYKGRDGEAGLRDFPARLTEVHEKCGFKYHSKVTIWKDPVIEMQRTKAHGLLWKQLRADSTFSRMGLAEYVIYFRKWAHTEEDQELVVPVSHTEEDVPVSLWQKWASPVWMDIQQTNVLNARIATGDADEKHICPLQLDLIERIVRMYSNPGDVVFSPFTGIGSEGYESLKHGRKFIGAELKEEYYFKAIENLNLATAQNSLFAEVV